MRSGKLPTRLLFAAFSSASVGPRFANSLTTARASSSASRAWSRRVGPLRKTRGQLLGERPGCVAVHITDDRDHCAGCAVAAAIVALDILAPDRGERVRGLAESVRMRRVHERIQAPLSDAVGLR